MLSNLPPFVTMIAWLALLGALVVLGGRLFQSIAARSRL